MKILQLCECLFLFTTVLILAGCKTDSTSPGDSTPPTILIFAPTDNSTVIDSVVVKANGADNVGIEMLELYVDGSLAYTYSGTPLLYHWDVGTYPNNSIHTLRAKAYDAAHNFDSSSTISVTVKRTEEGLQLNGSTDYVQLPISTSLSAFDTLITIEAWVKIQAYGSGGNIVTSGNENDYGMGVLSTGKVVVTMRNVNPQANAAFIGKSVLSLNTWYHVAFSYNGANEAIYINGAIDTSFNTTGTVNTPAVEEVTIGAYSWFSHTNHNGLFNGIIDEARLWNISRTSSQIQSTMNSELSGSEAGLAGHWNMNGDVLDKSMNGADGTIHGSANFVQFVR